jgi:transposase
VANRVAARPGGAQGERVAAVTGYSLTWVRTVARRYNAEGERGIGDWRQAHRGGPRLLTPEQEAALDQALAGAAPGGGRWTAAKVAAWMSQQLGRPVGDATGWRSLRSTGFPEHAARRQRRRLMALFEGYLRERWDAGEQNAATLFREVQAQGYRGSPSTLREQLSRWRIAPRTPGRRPVARTGQVAPAPARTFSARQTRWLLVGLAQQPDAVATAYTAALLERSPPIRQAQALVTEFMRLVRQRDAASLPRWVSQAQQSEITELVSFADGVRRDDAAALRLEWSQGQTEGQVHRLKLVKRQMYGRAKFDLSTRYPCYAAGS